MAETKIEIRYVKSPQWRAVSATGVSVGSIGGPGGLEVQMRFSYEWLDIEKEISIADVTTTAVSTTTTIKSTTATQTPMYKMEEVAVRMGAEGTVNLVAAALTTFSQLQPPNKLTDEQKKNFATQSQNSQLPRAQRC